MNDVEPEVTSASTGPRGGPGNKLAETSELLSSANGWATGTTAVSLPAGTYWLAYLTNDNGLSFRKREGTVGSKTVGAMPATFPTTTNTSGSVWSFYATLTPQAGPVSRALHSRIESLKYSL